MIDITPSIQIDEQEIEFVFIRSTGPGGQNVNKVSSAVQLRFNVQKSPSIPQEVKLRLVRLAGKRLTSDGVLIIEARQYRSQERNRQAALVRLVRLIQQACEPPKPRHKTKHPVKTKPYKNAKHYERRRYRHKFNLVLKAPAEYSLIEMLKKQNQCHQSAD